MAEHQTKTWWCQVRRLYKPGYRYKKAGVMLLDLSSASIRQGELFGPDLEADTNRRDRLLATLDSVNLQMIRLRKPAPRPFTK